MGQGAVVPASALVGLARLQGTRSSTRHGAKTLQTEVVMVFKASGEPSVL